MVLLFMLILPLVEDEKRSSRPLAKVEWMTELCDSTSKFGRYARPPPATDVSQKQSLSGSSKHHSGGLGVNRYTYILYSIITPPTRRT